MHVIDVMLMLRRCANSFSSNVVMSLMVFYPKLKIEIYFLFDARSKMRGARSFISNVVM